MPQTGANAPTPSRATKQQPFDGSDWPDEGKALYAWLATQDVLTRVQAPLHFAWWAKLTYVIGFPSVSWLSKEFAKMELWLSENPKRKPRPAGTSAFLRHWLERSYDKERRYA